MAILDHRTTLIPGFPAVSCTVLWLIMSGSVSAEPQQELLLFTSVDTVNTFSESDPSVDDSSVRGAMDVLYSYSRDRFRFLGEYLLSSDESELERLKVGWESGENYMLWLGRFHATSKHWTSEYHHGQYLQTSITRPSMEEWEDQSGPIPSHITGFVLQASRPLGDEAALNYVIGAGLAPKFKGQRLEPFDILDPRSGHGLSVNFKIAYRPKAFEMMQIGIISAWNAINVVSESNPALADLDEIDQLTAGVFADWRWDDLRLISSFVYFRNDLKYVDETIDDRFTLGYLQLEYGLNEDITFFGRADMAFEEDWSPYLRLLPAFVSHRHMLGVRWDIANFHALTLEIADTAQQSPAGDHDNFKEVRFQWSAVFP